MSGNLSKKLHQSQETEGLHLGNKLRAVHIDNFKRPMNVKLGVHLLSDSVADSCEFCLDQEIPDSKVAKKPQNSCVFLMNCFIS